MKQSLYTRVQMLADLVAQDPTQVTEAVEELFGDDFEPGGKYLASVFVSRLLDHIYGGSIDA